MCRMKDWEDQANKVVLYLKIKMRKTFKSNAEYLGKKTISFCFMIRNATKKSLNVFQKWWHNFYIVKKYQVE